MWMNPITEGRREITNRWDYSGDFLLFTLSLQRKRVQKEVNRGNNFHKTQQCEDEKIIKEGKGACKEKWSQRRKENILFNSISEMLSTFSCYRSYSTHSEFCCFVMRHSRSAPALVFVFVRRNKMCPLLISFNGKIYDEGLKILIYDRGTENSSEISAIFLSPRHWNLRLVISWQCRTKIPLRPLRTSLLFVQTNQLPFKSPRGVQAAESTCLELLTHFLCLLQLCFIERY